MQTNILLMANVSRSMIDVTDTHYNISGIPITVDDSVMNGVLYSAKENAKGMPSMTGSPITLGHPMVDGDGASARSGKGLEDFYSGGTITDIYNDSGVWKANASIKKKLLRAQDGGDEYADMLENKESIGVSTGLTFEDNEISGENESGDRYSKIAVNQAYDHLAFLANEDPAGGENTIMRFNVADYMPDDDQEEVEVEFKMKPSIFKRFMELFVKEADNGYNEQEFKPNQDDDGEDPMLDKIKAKLTAANVKVEGLDEDALLSAYNELITSDDKPKEPAANQLSIDDVTAAVNAAIKPLQDKIDASANKQVDELKTQMKAMAVNRLSDSVIDKMDAQEMKDHMAANGVVAFNAAGGKPHNRVDNKLDTDLPE